MLGRLQHHADFYCSHFAPPHQSRTHFKTSKTTAFAALGLLQAFALLRLSALLHFGLEQLKKPNLMTSRGGRVDAKTAGAVAWRPKSMCAAHRFEQESRFRCSHVQRAGPGRPVNRCLTAAVFLYYGSAVQKRDVNCGLTVEVAKVCKRAAIVLSCQKHETSSSNFSPTAELEKQTAEHCRPLALRQAYAMVGPGGSLHQGWTCKSQRFRLLETAQGFEICCSNSSRLQDNLEIRHTVLTLELCEGKGDAARRRVPGAAL